MVMPRFGGSSASALTARWDVASAGGTDGRDSTVVVIWLSTLIAGAAIVLSLFFPGSWPESRVLYSKVGIMASLSQGAIRRFFKVSSHLVLDCPGMQVYGRSRGLDGRDEFRVTGH